jgi:polyhydroxyalkanoate synthesis regulator phasin
MFDVLKESIYVGLGLASMARDKAEELIAEASKRAKLSEAEAKEFRDELLKRRDAVQRDLEAEIDQRIDHAFIQLGIVKAGIKKTSEEGTHAFSAFIDTQIEAALRAAGIASAADVQSLAERVERLEKRLSAAGKSEHADRS